MCTSVQLHKTTYWSRHDTSPPALELESKAKPSEFSDIAVANPENEVTIATISGNGEADNGNVDGEKKHRFVDPELKKGASADGKLMWQPPWLNGQGDCLEYGRSGFKSQSIYSHG